jgi:hypothetical protein
MSHGPARQKLPVGLRLQTGLSGCPEQVAHARGAQQPDAWTSPSGASPASAADARHGSGVLEEHRPGVPRESLGSWRTIHRPLCCPPRAERPR